jgi:hypothetical protein
MLCAVDVLLNFAVIMILSRPGGAAYPGAVPTSETKEFGHRLLKGAINFAFLDKVCGLKEFESSMGAHLATQKIN